MPAIDTQLYDKYKLQGNSTQKNSNELLQDDFLTLMTTQLKHQDPMKPMENGEFLGQMAQFSTVSGLEKLQKSFTSLANSMQSNQTLSAANLIGKEVLAEGNSASLQGETTTIKGAVRLPASTSDITVTILDSTGKPVRKINLGSQQEGIHEFTWDGKTTDGKTAPRGNYRFSAEFAIDAGKTESAQTLLYSKIESININEGTIQLNTADGKSHKLSEVTQIG